MAEPWRRGRSIPDRQFAIGASAELMVDAVTTAAREGMVHATADCTVVVPCYNEAARFRTAEFDKFLKSEENGHIRLLFVNDGSSDTTLSMIEALQCRFPKRIGLLNQQPNRGKAEAVRSGMLHIIASQQAMWTGFWDADLATPLAQIQDLLDLMVANPNLELVFGARVRLMGRKIRRRAARHYLGRCFATVVSLLIKLPVYDTQCGAKLFRITPVLSQVLEQPFLSRWIFDVEMLARFLVLENGDVRGLEHKIYEYPLPVWTDVAGSKVTSLDFIRAFMELASIYFRYIA